MIRKAPSKWAKKGAQRLQQIYIKRRKKGGREESLYINMFNISISIYIYNEIDEKTIRQI